MNVSSIQKKKLNNLVGCVARLGMMEIERRDCERYDFELPVHATWKDADGNIKKETGITRDISSSGVFMTCKNFIDRECKIDLQIELPVFVENAKSRIMARGKVVRNLGMTHSEKCYGYGIVFENYSFTRV